MTEGSPAKLILSFSLPLMAANLGQQLYMIVDTMIVGKGVGVEALASVGATDWSYWLALWVIQAMTQGFAISISQHFGEGNQSRIKKTVAMSIWLCLGIGVVLTVSGLVFAQFLLRILQTPDPIFQGALSYLMILYAGILVVMAYNMAAAILRSLGDGKTPLIAIVIAAITNILLDLLFVLVFRWGVAGAAFATVLAQLLAFIYCLLVMRKIDLLKMERKDWKPESSIIKRQCGLGIPLALQHVLIAIGGMILQSSINRHGFVFIAGFTATNKIYGLLESSAISLGYAVTTYTAQNYGAGRYDRIRNGLKSSVLIAAAMSVCVSAAMIAGGRAVLGLFIDSTSSSAAEVLEISYHYLFIMSCLLSSLYLLYAFRNTLQGLGNTVAPFLSGVMEFFARVSVAVYFSRLWGTEAIFFAEPCAWAAATLVLVTVCVRQVGKLREA
ncbi:MATE family efflux transporter [Enterocloster citroniae]|uniref:Probable multidrug resistance protein NorM n=3 Tax=Enterocloster citroniae TaxID=358743 RepID=A0AA41FI28_9FIRM|nr:MATE family efflux transporter [Enterocloster citroniae]RGC12128.1 MATE family efflux transporter [Enterocloster citroniae]